MKELTPKNVIQDSETDCEPKIVLNKNQWETIYTWCDEYHSVKSKPLLDEIAELKSVLGDALAESMQYGYLTNSTIEKANKLLND